MDNTLVLVCEVADRPSASLLRFESLHLAERFVDLFGEAALRRAKDEGGYPGWAIVLDESEDIGNGAEALTELLDDEADAAQT